MTSTNWRIPREGGHLYAESMGSGEPLVLLRGWGRSIRHWLGFDQLMAKDFRVITIDARGIGRSALPVSWGLTTETMACDVLAVLDYLQIPEAHVLGVSLGGMVALSFAKLFPQRTKSVIAANSSFRGSGALRMSPAAFRTVAVGAMNRKSLPQLLSHVLVSSGFDEGLRKNLVKEWQAIDATEHLDINVAFKQLLAAARFGGKSYFKNISTPALLIQGADDLFVPAKNTTVLHELMPNAKYVILPGAGHEPSLDQPESFQQAILQFTRALQKV